MPQPRDGSLRRAIRGVARVLAIAAALWAAWLFLFGGFDLHLVGRTISSHEPFRPVLITAIAFTWFMLVGGDTGVVRAARWAADRAPMVVTDRRCAVAAGALSAIVLVVSMTHGSKLASGSDPYGYVSEADLWLERGPLAVPMPWAREAPWPDPLWSFAPLAYRPTPTEAAFAIGSYRPTFDAWSIVPTYSPGLPMLMAAAKWIGGQPAVFVVVPIAGALFALATFGLGRRLGSPRLGLIAALLVAASPTTVKMELVSMSDVPVAAAWTLAWWGALGQNMRSAFGAAVALMVMLLIRPNLLPLALVLAAWTCSRIVREAPMRRRHFARAMVIALGLASGMLATAAMYWLAYGSPTVSGYGNVSSLFGMDNILPNLRHYGRWFLEEQTLLGYAGIAALFIPIARLWPRVTDRSVIVAFAVSFLLLVAEFCYFDVFESRAYLRFFLPAYPLIMIGLAGIGLMVARMNRLAAFGVATVVLLSVVLGIRESRPDLDAWSSEARCLEFLARVRADTNDNSVILSMQHSGGVRYHAGRVTLRWDYLAPAWLDRSVDWMADRGVRTYAVLDAWELDLVRQRFAGQRAAAAFDAPPVLEADGRMFFDLNASRAANATTAVISGVPTSNRALPAVPVPALVWKH